MSEQDREWHGSFKPSFTTDGQIIYRVSKPGKDTTWKEMPLVENDRSVVIIGQHAGGMVSRN